VIFALDLRSLALFRILLASLLLSRWVYRLPDLQAHFTDDGLLPRELLQNTFFSFSFHLFSGSYWFQALLAGLAILFAIGISGWLLHLADGVLELFDARFGSRT
jgi:hypothetical protein